MKTSATTSALKRYEEEYTSVSQLPYVDINQLQPASRGVVEKVKLPVYAGNTKVIGFATPRNNWQGVEPAAPIGYPGWITQPNVTINVWVMDKFYVQESIFTSFMPQN